jgi:hypothetical protein
VAAGFCLQVGGAILAGVCPLVLPGGCCMLRTVRRGLPLTPVARMVLPLLLLAMVAAVTMPAAATQTPVAIHQG